MQHETDTLLDAQTSADARTSALAGTLRELIGKLKRRLREEVGPGELTPSQTAVLGRLERDGPATVTTLARAEGVRSQSMSAIIAALEQAELVTGAPDPRDGRQTILSLTPACRAMIQATRAAREDWLLRAIRTRLTMAEREQLATGVALLGRLVEP
jgi:DNA-binding MarR family transcriptional regulator